MSKFKQYKRTQIAEMRPVTQSDIDSFKSYGKVYGDGMFLISISQPDRENGGPKLGDMIARNPANHEDQWLVAREYFGQNFAPVSGPDVKELPFRVFPNTEPCMAVVDDPIYGGAHRYRFIGSRGFNNGVAEYDQKSVQDIQFVQKEDDGTIIPGVQSEQLAYALLDRARKLNARFPSEYNEKMILGLEMFLEACEQRVRDRMGRGVMGDLKK